MITTIISHLMVAASVVFILAGLMFFFGAAVGVVRFPDFYTRMHAAGKGDTLSTILILLGAVLYILSDGLASDFPTAVKILTIALFIMLTSPTSTHALMQAGYDEGIKPFEKTKMDDYTLKDDDSSKTPEA